MQCLSLPACLSREILPYVYPAWLGVRENSTEAFFTGVATKDLAKRFEDLFK